MMRIKTKLSALFWLQGISRISLVLFGLLVIAVIIIGLDNALGMLLGILAVVVVMIELTRRWRKIRNFIIMFFTSILGIIFLAFMHEEVVTPFVRWLLGAGALNSSGFFIFNQVVSLVMVFAGGAGLIVGFFGTVVLSIVRLVAGKNGGRTAAGT